MSDYRAFSSDDRRSASPSSDDDSKHIEPIFSRELFGEQLASWLDTRYLGNGQTGIHGSRSTLQAEASGRMRIAP